MLGGNDNNPMHPICMDENRRLRYQTNASNQLQLFGSFNYFGNEHLTPRETEDILRQQKLQISLNYNVRKEEADRSTSIPNPHAVSTGLRLSYDDDERNSSVTSASGSMTQGTSMILSLGDNVTTELDLQKEEFDQYIKMQQEHLTKGIRDLTKRHTASFLAAVEKGVDKKLREKDVELETVNRKNRELFERIKQVTMEAQSWHYRAKYNESVVNALQTNLEQVVSQSQGAEQLGKEGFGDSEVDDAASYVDPNNFLSIPVAGGAKCVSGNHRGMICRACKGKEVSILLMPCRHLCLCKECDVLIRVCPVCQVMKTAGVQVYLS
ncbi:hypothetical protein like AT1G10650 [Hibiscus trionum]|uniref:RING-type domain-containing protein n=1 Tax=Hibiscus trionum TaxID=183268 RepID=A0A9W7M6V3_HIBTR|nr:hypothetical protein like AT1G10650 [Hibiscus trionum]